MGSLDILDIYYSTQSVSSDLTINWEVMRTTETVNTKDFIKNES